MRAFEFFGGTTELVVPDNLRSGVTTPDRYEPDLNQTYADMAAHYGVAVIPARVRKPRDKGKVEQGVLLAERWILAMLRTRVLFSFEEAREAINPEPQPGCPGCVAAVIAGCGGLKGEAISNDRSWSIRRGKDEGAR